MQILEIPIQQSVTDTEDSVGATVEDRSNGPVWRRTG